ncbi:MAG: hypothetical protein JXR84_18400 [Anaerolineae bacterium]|nr:hypothetical protein [Anaerolineae bacterium]
MPRIQIALNDELVQKLEGRASELGLELSEFLSQAIQHNADKLIRPKVWMPREKWDALVRGDKCNDCLHLASGDNPHGYTIAHLRVSRFDLLKTQFVPGCSVLYYREHVIEPYQMSTEEQHLYFAAIMQAAQALVQVFKPVKVY